MRCPHPWPRLLATNRRAGEPGWAGKCCAGQTSSEETPSSCVTMSLLTVIPLLRKLKGYSQLSVGLVTRVTPTICFSGWEEAFGTFGGDTTTLNLCCWNWSGQCHCSFSSSAAQHPCPDSAESAIQQKHMFWFWCKSVCRLINTCLLLGLKWQNNVDCFEGIEVLHNFIRF